MLAANFIVLMPEIILSMGSLFLLLQGSFQKDEGIRTIFNLTLICILLSIGTLIIQLPTTPNLIFLGQFVQDPFSQILKIIILSLTLMVLMGTKNSTIRETIAQFEYPILILLTAVGMMIMVSANGFLTLFMGLELQSLALYILSSIRRDNTLSSEAGMKYFILGALSTGMLLYGISFIYGAAGSISFDTIHQILSVSAPLSTGLIIGLFFVLAGVAFKMSIAPFHMWTPDVYEGAPTSVTIFLATVPKIAAFAVMTRLLINPFLSLISHWTIPLMVLSILSMIVGFLGILMQQNIKRLIAYSSIANAGFGLIGLLPGNTAGIQAMLIYYILYSVTILGFFLCITLLTRRGEKVITIQDLSGISKVYPGLTFVIVLLLFSLAGIPPLAGFLGKLYIFKVALQANYIPLAIIALLTSVLGAAYYLWIIKIITMDDINPENWTRPLSLTEDKSVYTLITVITGSIILFFIKPNIFVAVAEQAAASLFINK